MSAANVLSTDASPEGVAEPRAAEPSMEDILASIRRIIADDQSRGLASSSIRRAGALGVNPPGTARPERPATATAAEASATPAATEAPPSTAAAVAEPARSDPPPSAATIDASARPTRGFAGAAPRHPMAPEPPVPHLNPPETPAPAPALLAEPEVNLSLIAEIAMVGAASIRGPVEASPLVVDLEPPPFKAPSDEPTPVSAEPRSETVETLAGVGEDIMAEEPDVLPLAGYEAVPVDGEADPLLSDLAGASVEASFQALATSVFLSNTDHLDAMMRDMLRPMLKTWLDDNLPTIVERLVRGEIERVARGGRG